MLLPNRAAHFQHFLHSAWCTKEFCSFSFPGEASGNGKRKVWVPRVGIMCTADSALALQSPVPSSKNPSGKILGWGRGFFGICYKKTLACAGQNLCVLQGGSLRSKTG